MSVSFERSPGKIPRNHDPCKMYPYANGDVELRALDKSPSKPIRLPINTKKYEKRVFP